MTDTSDSRHPEASLQTDEVMSVLSHYDIGETKSIRVYSRGSSQSPKALVESNLGQFILKRRGPGRDDPRRIVYEHAVHDRLHDAGYPIVEIISSAKSHSKVVTSSGRIYELFRYVKASRCEGDPVSLKASGQALAIFHETLRDFDAPSPPVRGFHAVTDIQQHIERYAATLRSKGRRACQAILDGYQQAALDVESMGWSQWPQTVVHGDWHPGNVLFGDKGEVLAVLDFDAVRWETRTSDLASAILHFGRYVSALRSNEDSIWPVSVDATAACSLLRGYVSEAQHQPRAMELTAIPPLMIEALVLEIMPPVIREGRFGPLEDTVFLPKVVESIQKIKSDSGLLIASLGAIVK